MTAPRESVTADQRRALGTLADGPLIRLQILNHANVGRRTFDSLLARRLIRSAGVSPVTGQLRYILTPRGKKVIA